MIWDFILTAVFSWGIGYFMAPTLPNDELKIGNKYENLNADLKDTFSRSYHKVVDNRHFDDTAPNTDNCFSFNSQCLPDAYHTIYYIQHTDNHKHYDVIELTRNGTILTIKDTYVK